MIFGFYVDNSFYAGPDFFDIVRVLIEVSSIVIFLLKWIRLVIRFFNALYSLCMLVLIILSLHAKYLRNSSSLRWIELSIPVVIQGFNVCLNSFFVSLCNG